MNHIENLKILFYSGFIEVRFGVDKDGRASAVVQQELGSVNIAADCNGRLTHVTHYSISAGHSLYKLFHFLYSPKHYDVHIALDDAEYVNTDIINTASTVLQQLIGYGINDVTLQCTYSRRVPNSIEFKKTKDSYLFN